MSTETVERPRSAGPEEGLGGNWLVIVLNDDHNTFDHVAQTLSRVIPGISLDSGYRLADKIHNSGQAAVWTGPRETAALYWKQLQEACLPMAPLEQNSTAASLRLTSSWSGSIFAAYFLGESCTRLLFPGPPSRRSLPGPPISSSGPGPPKRR